MLARAKGNLLLKRLRPAQETRTRVSFLCLPSVHLFPQRGKKVNKWISAEAEFTELKQRPFFTIIQSSTENKHKNKTKTNTKAKQKQSFILRKMFKEE